MKPRLLLCAHLIGTSLFLFSCGRNPAPQESCHFVQNSQNQRVSWENNLPVKISLHNSVPTTSILSIELAAEEWKRKMGKEMISIELTGVGGPNDPQQDGKSLVYWLHAWEADRPTEQARTTVYWTGSKINEADVRVNANNFIFYNGDGTEAFSGVDTVSLLVHEFGHVLGLAHIEKGSVMSPILNSGTLRREPMKLDLASLHCEY